ncbi:DUF2075 domain-containing protein [Siphonobacter curvatus]|uniref:AAA family ATPase n=1 Tax=Siphonobacter curvatus TaxID=2094562 RepID=A0A2S7II65_9BACT|nr:DUF2075 domain-containing protein [Siphonobacter curvatus]PQA55656.1 AAA family ATPase [Siphonobacter curvatus]
MIIYQANKLSFKADIETGNIEEIILHFFEQRLNRSTSKSEVQSWRDSLLHMNMVLSDSTIPDDCGVAIEYQIPMTSKRIDVILTGQSENHQDLVVLVELKRWETAELTQKDGIVKTRFSGGIAETSHPSYQAWSYASLLKSFNETVYAENIPLHPCAFLHNYKKDEVITHAFYQTYIDKAPVFLKTDLTQLRAFIKSFIRYGDTANLLHRIEESQIKPSKNLADSLASMMKGKPEFILIDEQKLVYETALSLARVARSRTKQVLIVKGGPGTGKSVIAINLLVSLIQERFSALYTSKNSAPRKVYESKLTGTLRASEISNLFLGSGSFTDKKANSLNVLIVDEAHRLNEKSGLFSNLGENQVKEIINTAECSIFFLDENQRIHLKDIGSEEEIARWASAANAQVTTLELSSQFRCSGSDGYLAWLDQVLQIRETANDSISDLGYDFRIFDNPNELRQAIELQNHYSNKARMVAGYCWEWDSKKNPQAYDVILPEFDFKMRWNLTTDGSLWIIAPNSVNEIGCIHTCQGLEVDYIGVIVGEDLGIDEQGHLYAKPEKRAKSDASIKGYKKLLKEDPDNQQLVEEIIKNTYRTLMTRGIRGCYVYFVDKRVEAYFKSHLI